MKKLFKFFIPVVALAAYSCATDMTEDLGVELGGGHTTIEVSLDGSRTHIADAVDGKYPVYWSAGDQISVDGKASDPLTEGGSASATFTFGATLETPYCVAYPAAKAGQVLFANKQQHTDGTFGDGVATMYGFSENGLGLTLNHLTGVLKIGVTGDATLTKAQISTVDRAPIAGPFAIDFTTGEVTPTAESVDVINYSLVGDESDGYGEGMVLGSEAQYIHVAVPAGVYNELYVTLYDTKGGVMYATVKATDEKPLNAGNVRTFSSDIAYKANTDVFVVSSVATLQSFASQAKESSKDVVFVEDIDMTGVEWTPIEGYAGTVYGNGYAIKGLTAPLFGSTNASFKGLHLEDVNINETALPAVGALARIILEEAGSTLERSVTNCSVSGKITLNCDGVDLTEYNPIWCAAGLVGASKVGIKITNCTSEAEIVVNKLTVSESSDKKSAYIGGVIGYNGSAGIVDNLVSNATITVGTIDIAAGDDVAVGGVAGMISYLTNSENSGAITIKGTYTGRLFVGGAVGYTMAIITNQNKKVSNSGAITITKDAVCNSAAYVGGVAGCTKFSTTDLSNSGPISISGTYNGNTHIAGNTAWLYAKYGTNVITNADNSGDITIEKDAVFTSLGGFPAGYATGLNEAISETDDTIYSTRTNPYIAGCCAIGNTAITGCDNSGDITIKSTSMNGGFVVAGIYTFTTKKVSVCKNSGDITFTESAVLANNGFVTGGVGSITAQGIEDLTNRGDISFYGTNSGRLFVGGCVGQSMIYNTLGNETICKLYNYGKITLQGKMTTEGASTNVGGIACYLNGAAKELYNYKEATITVAHSQSSSNVNVGGIAADAERDLTTVENYAAITINGATGNNLYVGGLTAYHSSVNQRTANKNTGEITVKNTTAESINVGGLYGSVVRLTCTDCHNEGNITVENFVNTGTMNTVGGIGARLYDATNTVTLTHCTNSGDISVDATADTSKTAGLYVGGVLGYHHHAKSNVVFMITADKQGRGVENSGNITVKTNSGTKDCGLGGVLGYSIKPIASTTDGVTTHWTGTIKNSGAITVVKHADSNLRVMAGGVVGVHNQNPLGTDSQLINTGDITCSGTVKSTDHIGGVVGKSTYAIHNARCFCNIKAVDFPRVGMISGIAIGDSSATAIKTSHIGGTICTSTREWKESDGESLLGTLVPDVKTLNYTTYYQYIYGIAYDKAQVDTDKNGYISAINATPVDYTGNPIVAE